MVAGVASSTGSGALYSSGLNTPESELELVLPTHPTAVRRPYPIVVQSENTAYTDEHITAMFNHRGADVVTTVNGQFQVTPTAKSFQFQTESESDSSDSDTTSTSSDSDIFSKLNVTGTLPNLKSRSARNLGDYVNRSQILL